MLTFALLLTKYILNMINEFKKFALGLFACLALISFNACGDDDNDPTPDPKPEKVTATISYAYSCQPDLLLATDITISYVDSEGKEVSEAVKDKEWKKDLTNVAVPFTANMKVVYAKKEGFTPDKDAYNFGDGYGISYKTSNNKSESNSSTASSISIAKDRVIEYIDTFIAREKATSAEIK